MYGRPRESFIYLQEQNELALKTAITILCFFLFLFSIGVFGFGVWLAVWTSNFNYISVIMNYDIYRAGYILFIISGVLLMVVSLIGLCGSIQENSCLLLTFIIVTIICEIMLITVAAVGMTFNYNFNQIFATNLTSSIKFIYGINTQQTRNNDVTTAIDQIQTQFSCCGTNGLSNSSSSWELYKSSTWILTQNYGPPYVPLSCCKLNDAKQVSNSQICQGVTSIGSPFAPPVLNSNTENIYLNTQGCIKLMTDSVNYFSMAMFGLSLAAALYVIIILILSFYLLRRIEVSKKGVSESKVTIINPASTSPKSAKHQNPFQKSSKPGSSLQKDNTQKTNK